MPGEPPAGDRRARVAVTVTFLAHAAVFATWAPRIPSIKDDLRLSHDDLGFALGVLAVGMLVGTRLTARMERRRSTGAPIRLLMPVQCVALAGPAYATNLLTLCVALFVLGLLGGLIDVAMNAHAVALERRYRRPIMSGFHGLWSVGMMAASAAAALVARFGVGVRPHFVVAAAVLALGSAPVLRWLLPAAQEGASSPAAGDTTGAGCRPLASVFVVAVLAVVGFGSFVAEGAIMDWGAVLLHEDQGASESVAALGLTVFTGAMALSRLVGDRLRGGFGSAAVARAGAAVAVAGLGTVLLAGHPTASMIGLAVLGLGVGPLVPIVFSGAGNTPTRWHGSALGITVSAGYLGSVTGPVLIGLIASGAGLAWALAVPIAFLIVAFFTARLFESPRARRPEGALQDTAERDR